MGVVRDVTIDQLTQAVQGISTSGMSDSTGQAINSTLGTLGKDTSLQDIKNAINNLAGAISPSATNVTFDNTGTGLTASNVQALGVELNNKINDFVKKSSVSLTFDTTGRATINFGMGRIVAVDFKTTSYTYTLRYLSSAQTLIYLRNPNTLALVTNESNAIAVDLYYI